MCNEWIEWAWSEEKPYPETLDTLVRIKCLSDGYEETDDYSADVVSFWMEERSDNIWEPHHHGSITHYRLA